LLPRENEKDLEEIDPEILARLHVTLVGEVNEAINIILQNTKKLMRLCSKKIPILIY